MSKDLQAMTRALIDLLEREGMSEDAKALKDAEGLSNVVTEILMALRWNIRERKIPQRARSPKTVEAANELLRALDHALA
jgi:hypothetical protein